MCGGVPACRKTSVIIAIRSSSEIGPIAWRRQLVDDGLAFLLDLGAGLGHAQTCPGVASHVNRGHPTHRRFTGPRGAAGRGCQRSRRAPGRRVGQRGPFVTSRESSDWCRRRHTAQNELTDGLIGGATVVARPALCRPRLRILLRVSSAFITSPCLCGCSSQRSKGSGRHGPGRRARRSTARRGGERLECASRPQRTARRAGPRAAPPQLPCP